MFVLAAEAVVISVLWLTNSISRTRLLLGMAVFAATFLAILIAGQLLKRARKSEGAWKGEGSGAVEAADDLGGKAGDVDARAAPDEVVDRPGPLPR